MQFCNLHHCVLFFLIFTFTTAPVSSLEICPTRGKLHQPVTLSCTTKCSGLLIWNILSNRDVVLAQCDQTSCKSEEGFSISHDQYLKGDSSLTITAADYSKRNVYACECEDSDFVHVRLVIETVFTPVQMKSDEDLKLKVSVPEPVEVIYKRGDAADKVICSVTKDSLQCKDEYRHRTSLTYPELTLRHMTPRDSGSYTIRDTKNNEDIQIYAVSVEAVVTLVQMKSDEDLKLKVSVPEPVEVIYKSSDSADEVICSVTKDSLQCKDDYRHRTSLIYPELTLRHMTKGDSGIYTIRDTKNNEDIQIYAVSVEAVFTPVQMKYDEDLKLKVSVPEPVEVIYKRGDAADEVICNVTNGSLQCKDKYRDRTSLTYPELTLRHVTPRDKATYTIRNIEYNDDIQIYAVSVEAVFIPVQTKSDEDLKLKVSVPEPVEVIYKSDDAADEVICNVTKDSLQCKDDYRHRTSLTYPELTLRHMTKGDSGTYTIRDTEYNEDIQIYAVSVEEQSGVPAWVIVLILILVCCCVGAVIFLLYKYCMRKQQLERRLQQVDQLVQEALRGTEEKIREAETSVDQLQQQYINTVYEHQVKVFCSEKRRQLLERRLQLVDQLVQEALRGTEKEIREAETSVDQLQQQYNKTVYEHQVTEFCSEKRRQLFEGHLKQVDLLVQEALGGTEEKIREVEKSLNQLQQQYNNTVYKDTVKVFCSEKRGQLLERRLQQVDLLVQEALGGTEEKIREVETSVEQLQQQYINTVYEDKVKVFCSEKRRQLLKSHLLPLVQPLKEHEEWKKEDIENLERKLNWLMSLYRKSEHFNDVLLLCMEQRSQISWNRLQYSKEEPFVTKRSELHRKLHHVEQLVQQAEAGKEEKITEANKAIDELEQQYSYTEYSKEVLKLCGVKREKLTPVYSVYQIFDEE
ncbi:uncharacterized protein LOC113637378 isoform X4 [Tachysurus fulvidraco]|uniref:uncharacterized protein LOC113637378 isoform X4 n=1 Tax=Tachysurus fulvidraco TaxID=1234273 RepID=UPI001FED7E0B|nr:uncharacterized protein LOC113637378 isoform X4 [Tachysurus fulvidraco]